MIQGARAEVEAEPPRDEVEPEPPTPADAPRRWPALALGALLGAAAIGWVAALALGLAGAGAALTPLRLLAWIGLGCAPLALLATLALLARRGGRLRLEHYAETAAGLRADVAALTGLVADLAGQTQAARDALAAQAGQLAAAGQEANGRLARAAAELGGQADLVRRTAAGLDEAAATARADLGVLLGDLPQAEAVAAAIAERLRGAGAEADTRARTLADLLDRLDRAGQDAAETGGGAAARLAAQLDRVEQGAEAATRRLGEAAGAMDGAVSRALDGATDGVDRTRDAVAAQAAALAALVDQGRAAIDAAGAEAATTLGQRLDAIAARLDTIGDGLGQRDRAARDWLAELEQALGAVEARLAGFVRTGSERTAGLQAALEGLQGRAEGVSGLLGRQERAAAAVLERVAELAAQAEAGSITLGETLPAALARARLGAEQGLAAIQLAGERGERLRDTADAALAALQEADRLARSGQQALDEGGERAGARLQLIAERTETLRTAVGQADAELRALSGHASAELLDALAHVREAARVAGAEASDAITAAIPRAAQRLGESAGRALAQSLADIGQAEIDAVGDAAAQAADTARNASEALSRQLLLIAETATAIDARIAANQADTAAHDEQSFARAAALLMEALQSTSIDLVRLLDAEVGDEAWRRYLKGERGVFTRRAVRLLERAEAGEIARRWEAEPDFQAQVNRYVAEFEALLRRVMGGAEGDALATALLSSDMGKLYVALAQAIERFRR